MGLTATPLILASASASRVAMLRAAGVAFVAEPSAIDEAAIKHRFRAAGRSALDCAAALAAAKAGAVALRHPEALVVGADQILVVGDERAGDEWAGDEWAGDEWLDKPGDLAEAAAQLRRLRGRTHVLATAACAVSGGTCLWQAASVPKLTMRRFGEAFLDRYIGAEGEAVLGSVGAYRIEGRGVQLFASVEGDHFAILGLPLIELLGFLRERGLVEE